MAGFQSLKDLLFPAAAPLRSAAAGAPAPAAPAPPAPPSGIDIGDLANKQAARQLAKPPAAAAPAAPVKKKKKPGTADVIGSQLMEQ
jgi:hypothetical protein